MKPNGSGGDLISCGFMSPLGCLRLWIQHYEKQFPVFNLIGTFCFIPFCPVGSSVDLYCKLIIVSENILIETC